MLDFAPDFLEFSIETSGIVGKSGYLREHLFIGDRDKITLEVINDWWPIIWSHQYVANGDAAQSVLAACRAGDVDGYLLRGIHYIHN